MKDFLLRITEPHSSVHRPETVRILRLIAGIHLFASPIPFIIYSLQFIIPSKDPFTFQLALFAALVSIFDYIITRSRYVKIAIYLPPIVSLIFSLFLHFYHPEKIQTIFVPLIAILMGAVFFSLRDLRRLIVCSWLLMVFIVFDSPPSESGAFVGASILCSLITIMIYAIRWHQTWLQNLYTQKIQRSFNEQLSLMEEAFDGVIHLKHDEVIKVSDGVLELFEIETKDILGQSLQRFFPQGIPIIQEVPLQIYNSKKEVLYVEIVQKEGYRSDEIIYALRDVTQSHLQRINLQVTDRFSAMGTIAGGVVHELNTPLMIAQGNIDNLLAKNIVAEELKITKFALQQINDIINDVKIFSHLDKEGYTEDAKTVVDGVVRLMRHQFGHQCDFVTRLEQNYSIGISEGKFAQILLNLISNGAKSKREGQAMVQVSIHMFQQDDLIVLHVEDDGCGMTKEEQNRIFEPFFTKEQSTGLGLSITEGLVVGVGGSIHYESRHIGSRFVVQLPNKKIKKSEVQDFSMEENLPLLSILVIDNEQHIVDIVIEMLSDHSCNGSTNIDDAIGMMQDKRYDFILCDIIMPIKGGKDLLQYCEKNMPDLLSKLIFMTGGTITLKTDNCFQKYPMIQKPFRMQVLLSCIAQMTQRETT